MVKWCRAMCTLACGHCSIFFLSCICNAVLLQKVPWLVMQVVDKQVWTVFLLAHPALPLFNSTTSQFHSSWGFFDWPLIQLILSWAVTTSSTIHFLKAVSVCCHHISHHFARWEPCELIFAPAAHPCSDDTLRGCSMVRWSDSWYCILGVMRCDENMWHLYTFVGMFWFLGGHFEVWILRCTICQRYAFGFSLVAVLESKGKYVVPSSKFIEITTYKPNHKPTACIVYTMLLSFVSCVLFIRRVAFVTRQHWGCAACCWTDSGAWRGRCLWLETLGGMAGTILFLDESVASMFFPKCGQHLGVLTVVVKGRGARSRCRTEFVAIYVLSCLHVRFVCEFS